MKREEHYAQATAGSLLGRIEELEEARETAHRRIALAREALVATGYFTEDQVGDDIAPRITELWSFVESRENQR